MLRVTLPNGIPFGIPNGIPAPESRTDSQTGSRSGDSRNSTPVDALRLADFFSGGYSQIQSHRHLPSPAARIGFGESR